MPWLIKVGWLIPGWAAAQTWGFIILVRKDYANQTTIIAHELRHFVQSAWFGFILWPVAYVVAWAIAGFDYEQTWFEVDARRHAQDSKYVLWAHRLIARSE